jgi:hypothetical protein
MSSEYSIGSSQRRLRGWEWGSPFAVQSLKPTMVAFGQKQVSNTVHSFGFHYQLAVDVPGLGRGCDVCF